jgi:hypothetical protein
MRSDIVSNNGPVVSERTNFTAMRYASNENGS